MAVSRTNSVTAAGLTTAGLTAVAGALQQKGHPFPAGMGHYRPQKKHVQQAGDGRLPWEWTQ